MTNRYYFPDLPQEAATIRLVDSEAQHAIRVMRVQIGAEITLFDGKGNETTARVTQIGRSECSCETLAPTVVDRSPDRQLHLGIALPKPDRARELIERLTELGVKQVTPLIAARTQRPPSESQLDKLHRGVIEACKQCGRNDLLEVSRPAEAKDFFAASHAGHRVIAHPANDADPVDSIGHHPVVIAAIGPEGGWTDDEVSLAMAHGFRCVNLGSRIYRIETAAVVVATIVTYG